MKNINLWLKITLWTENANIRRVFLRTIDNTIMWAIGQRISVLRGVEKRMFPWERRGVLNIVCTAVQLVIKILVTDITSHDLIYENFSRLAKSRHNYRLECCRNLRILQVKAIKNKNSERLMKDPPHKPNLANWFVTMFFSLKPQKTNSTGYRKPLTTSQRLVTKCKHVTVTNRTALSIHSSVTKIFTAPSSDGETAPGQLVACEQHENFARDAT